MEDSYEELYKTGFSHFLHSKLARIRFTIGKNAVILKGIRNIKGIKQTKKRRNSIKAESRIL